MFHILLSFMMIEPTKATVVNAAHPLKAYAPIVDTLSGITIVTNEVQP